MPAPRPHDASNDAIKTAVRDAAEVLVGLSHRIHANPELGWQEHRAHAAGWPRCSPVLVSRSKAGIGRFPTALRATAGSGPLHVGLCAEVRRPARTFGHACKPMILAVSVGAAVGLRGIADDLRADGDGAGNARRRGRRGQDRATRRGRLRRPALRADGASGTGRRHGDPAARGGPHPDQIRGQDGTRRRVPRARDQRRRCVHRRRGRYRPAAAAASPARPGARHPHAQR